MKRVVSITILVVSITTPVFRRRAGGRRGGAAWSSWRGGERLPLLSKHTCAWRGAGHEAGRKSAGGESTTDRRQCRVFGAARQDTPCAAAAARDGEACRAHAELAATSRTCTCRRWCTSSTTTSAPRPTSHQLVRLPPPRHDVLCRGAKCAASISSPAALPRTASSSASSSRRPGSSSTSSWPQANAATRWREHTAADADAIGGYYDEATVHTVA